MKPVAIPAEALPDCLSSSLGRRGRRWSERLALAVLLLIATLVHAHSLWLGFWFDDHYHLEMCHRGGVRALIDGNRFEWAGRILHVWWAQREMSYAYFRPLAVALRAAELWLFGLHAVWFHIVQLTWHVATVALLYSLLRRCGAGAVTAWTAGFFFTVHPVQCNTVSWLANDGVVLAGFWTAAGLWLTHASACRGHRSWGVLAGIFLSYLCAMLSRENGIILGPLAILFDLLWTRVGPSSARGEATAPAGTQCRGLLYAMLALEGIGFVLIRAACLGAAPLPHAPYIHWPTEPGFASWLAYKLLHDLLSLPLALPFFPIAEEPWLQARPVTAGVMLLLLVLVGLVVLWPLRRSALTWGLLAGIGLVMLPTLPAFSVPHNLYLPAAGWAILLALWARRMWSRRRRFVIGTLVVLSGLYGACLGANCVVLRGSCAAERSVLDGIAATDPAFYPPGTCLFFVNLPIGAAQVGPALHLAAGRADLQVYPLTMIPDLATVNGKLRVVQEDARTLTIATEGDGWFAGEAGRLILLGWFGTLPADLKPGPFVTPAAAGPLPFRVEVLKADSKGVQALRFVFDRPLDDPHYRLFVGSSAHAAQCQSFSSWQAGAQAVTLNLDCLPDLGASSPLQSRQRSLDRTIAFLARLP